MRIRDFDNTCVVDIENPILSDCEVSKLERLLTKKAVKKRIGLNLENVTSLSHEFGRFIQSFASKSKLSLFNMSNDLLLFLYITKYDKSADIYLNEFDFCDDKHSFVNRRFKVLNNIVE